MDQSGLNQSFCEGDTEYGKKLCHIECKIIPNHRYTVDAYHVNQTDGQRQQRHPDTFSAGGNSAAFHGDYQ